MIFNKFFNTPKNFDSLIYLMGGTEFGFLPPFMLDMMRKAALHCYLVPFILLVGLRVFALFKNKPDSEDFGYHMFQTPFESIPALVFLLIQTGFFFVLMYIVARLRVLFLPIACVCGGVAVSPALWKGVMGRRMRDSLPSGMKYMKYLRFLAVLPLFYSFPWEEIQAYPMTEFAAQKGKTDMVNWMLANLPKGTAVLCDMPTSGSLRSATRFKTVSHPQYEDVKIRKRTQFIYAASACPPIEEIWERLQREYNTTIFISSVFRCAAPRNAKPDSVSVWDVAAAIDETRYRCEPGTGQFDRFCWRLQLDPTHFDLLYRNGHYAVYRTRTTPTRQADQMISYRDFNGAQRVKDPTVWNNWFDKCKQHDPNCGVNMCEWARQLIDLYGLKSVSEVVYNKAVELHPNDSAVAHHFAEFLDYDANRPKDAGQYYRQSIAGDPTNIKYIMDFVMFLDAVEGREKSAAELAALLKEFLALYDATKLNENDMFELVKAAAMLNVLSKDSRVPVEIRKHNWEIQAKELWAQAKRQSIQHQAVNLHWNVFEGHNKTGKEQLMHFLFGW
eukprot:GHVN01069203.1.p1 GENE.GHVN01069203.1~~GHVN01069203.1.p1  ORF type:complete len:558 (+),score=79.52 GHVN01069203.1:893-2566(+)